MAKLNGVKPLQILLNYGLIFALCIIVIIVSFISDQFLTPQNIMNVLRQVSTTGVLALGVSAVIIAGHMDLSIGSTLTLSGVLCMTLVNKHNADVLGILMGVLAGLAAGVCNGLIIANITGKKERKGESFIITYGMQAVAAAALLFTNGVYINGSGSKIHSLIGKGSTPVIIFLAIALILYLVISRTSFGRTIYFIGMNEQAARMSGINIKRRTVWVFVISGLCAGIAGVILTSRVNAASSTAGVGMELEAIAAVVVGGTALSGGKGGILRTVLGVFIMGILQNALHILNVSTYPQMMIRGTIIITAVLLDVLAAKLRVRGA